MRWPPLTDARRQLVRLDVGRIGLLQPGFFRSLLEVVAEAGDGEEAIAVVERLRPNVVIMDVNMPRKNGIEATRELKARFSHIAIIGISVNVGGDNEQAMLSAGASVLLTKEAAVEQLYVKIRDVMKVSGIGMTSSVG